MYVLIENNEVVTFPYSYAMLQRDNPAGWPPRMTDNELEAWGVYKVTIAPDPIYDEDTEVAVKNSKPSLVGNSWVLGWTVREKTTEELAQDRARRQTAVNIERDRRLVVGKGFTPTGYGQPVYLTILDRDNLENRGGHAWRQVQLGNGSDTMVWRDDNNVNHTLTFAQMSELRDIAGAYVEAVIQAAWTLKDADPVPANYTDDTHWPS